MSYQELSGLKTRTMGMTQDDVDAAKADPVNEVYEYEDKPLEPWQRMDARAAHAMGDAIRRAYLDLRRREPTWADSRIRARLGAQDKAWASFGEHSHTTMFLALTDRESTDSKIDIVRYIARVRTRVDAGTMSEDDATRHLQEYLLEKCKVDKCVEVK